MNEKLEDRSLGYLFRTMRTQGLPHTLSLLTVPEIYALAAGLVTVAGSVGAFAYHLIAPKIPAKRPGDLVHCYEAKNYPTGKWMESGFTEQYNTSNTAKGERPAVAEFLYMETPTKGWVPTDEYGSAHAEVTIDKGSITANADVTSTVVDKSSEDAVPYVSHSTMHVSPDGCTMSGEWWDNYDGVYKDKRQPNGDKFIKQRGRATLFWVGRSSAWVKRDPDSEPPANLSPGK